MSGLDSNNDDRFDFPSFDDGNGDSRGAARPAGHGAATGLTAGDVERLSFDGVGTGPDNGAGPGGVAGGGAAGLPHVRRVVSNPVEFPAIDATGSGEIPGEMSDEFIERALGHRHDRDGSTTGPGGRSAGGSLLDGRGATAGTPAAPGVVTDEDGDDPFAALGGGAGGHGSGWRRPGESFDNTRRNGRGSETVGWSGRRRVAMIGIAALVVAGLVAGGAVVWHQYAERQRRQLFEVTMAQCESATADYHTAIEDLRRQIDEHSSLAQTPVDEVTDAAVLAALVDVIADGTAIADDAEAPSRQVLTACSAAQTEESLQVAMAGYRSAKGDAASAASAIAQAADDVAASITAKAADGRRATLRDAIDDAQYVYDTTTDELVADATTRATLLGAIQSVTALADGEDSALTADAVDDALTALSTASVAVKASETEQANAELAAQQAAAAADVSAATADNGTAAADSTGTTDQYSYAGADGLY
ncbi:hypothetical protein [Bifidobacterium choloepi]|uniref:hypothetical protein n=1 Tax=Bifidobacterium choloepi TaxID=2614131 RepID=UPI0013D15703|nr:hypothetical protein [Bifidobacterium choloepi]